MTSTGQCSICLEEFKAPIGMLDKCKHIFCYDCIKKWSETKRTCPLDRTKFDTIKILLEIGGAIVEEEKLEPWTANPPDSIFDDDDEDGDDDDDDDDVDHYAVLTAPSRGVFVTRLVVSLSSQRYICHRCFSGIAEGRMVRCRGCDRPFHMECLIGTEHRNYPYMCSSCQPQRTTSFRGAIPRSTTSFFMYRFRHGRRRRGRH